MVRELERWALQARRDGFGKGATEIMKRASELKAKGDLPEKLNGASQDVYYHPCFDFYPQEAIVVTNGEKRHLTPLESKLLACLTTTPNKLWPIQVLVDTLWEDNRGTYTSGHLRVYISSLRKKIEPKPEKHKPRIIINTPYIGYMLKDPPLTDSS